MAEYQVDQARLTQHLSREVAELVLQRAQLQALCDQLADENARLREHQPDAKADTVDDPA